MAEPNGTEEKRGRGRPPDYLDCTASGKTVTDFLDELAGLKAKADTLAKQPIKDWKARAKDAKVDVPALLFVEQIRKMQQERREAFMDNVYYYADLAGIIDRKQMHMFEDDKVVRPPSVVLEEVA